MRDFIQILEASQQVEKLEYKKPKYSVDQLSPSLSESNVDVHLNSLTKNYFKKFQETGSMFAYAGGFLHNIWWANLQKTKTNNLPFDASLDFINKHFDNFVAFKEKILEEVLKIQGSGWVYLAKDGSIKTIKNHQVKKDIILLIDVWEHAMTDYDFDRKKYIANIWKIINWTEINKRLEKNV